MPPRALKGVKSLLRSVCLAKQPSSIGAVVVEQQTALERDLPREREFCSVHLHGLGQQRGNCSAALFDTRASLHHLRFISTASGSLGPAAHISSTSRDSRSQPPGPTELSDPVRDMLLGSVTASGAGRPSTAAHAAGSPSAGQRLTERSGDPLSNRHPPHLRGGAVRQPYNSHDAGPAASSSSSGVLEQPGAHKPAVRHHSGQPVTWHKRSRMHFHMVSAASRDLKPSDRQLQPSLRALSTATDTGDENAKKRFQTWVAVHQSLEKGLARFYLSEEPLSEEVVKQMSGLGEPFHEQAGLVFRKPDHQDGHWRNYRVTLVGEVAAVDDYAQFPNQVIHGGREMYNMRHGGDLAGFLAEPDKENMLQHMQNLKYIQQDRRYKPGWVFHRLASKHGREAVKTHNLASHL